MLIKEIIGLDDVRGEVGIEIEIEGEGIPSDDFVRRNTSGWKAEVDGSLKAAEALEYVLRVPVGYRDVSYHLNQLWDNFRVLESKIFESPKAGVHIHLNVQNFTVVQLTNLATLWFIFEKPLVKFCGPNREGNLFCLRASDASEMIDFFRSVVQKKKFQDFKTDEYRYSSINFKSVADYGSVEFRTMRSTGDMVEILKWIDILYELYEAAKVFNDPRDIISCVSGDGYEDFLKRIFKKTHELIPRGDTFQEDIYEGICNAQDIAYCVNWAHYTPKRSNPFK